MLPGVLVPAAGRNGRVGRLAHGVWRRSRGVSLAYFGIIHPAPWLGLWNISVPLWWPAALAVASLAWFQAVVWVPFGVPLLRIILASVLIPGLVAITGICVQSGVSETNLSVMFAGLSAIGWTVGFAGVKYARRGAIPDWSLIARPWLPLTSGRIRRRQPFADAIGAHVWSEWRRHGRGLPILTAVVLPFLLLPLLFGKNEAIPTERTVLGAGHPYFFGRPCGHDSKRQQSLGQGLLWHRALYRDFTD